MHNKMLLKENSKYILYVNENFHDWKVLDENFIDEIFLMEIVSKENPNISLIFLNTAELYLELTLDNIKKAYEEKGLKPGKNIGEYFTNENSTLVITSQNQARYYFETEDEMDSYIPFYKNYSYKEVCVEIAEEGVVVENFDFEDGFTLSDNLYYFDESEKDSHFDEAFEYYLSER
ncbi:MAG: hypothetical protein ACRC5T_10015 [Cetobacterium sp.]